MQESTITTVTKASFQYSASHRIPLCPTGVLQLERLHDDLAHRVAVEREGEAQRERDDEAPDQNVGIQSGVRIQHVRSGVAAESEIAGEGIEQIKDQDEQIGEEHHHAHTLARGTLHLADDRNELHLRAVAVAEHGQGEEDVSRDNEPLEVRFDRVRHARLAAFHAGAEAGAGGFFDVGFDDAGGVLADVVGFFGEGAGMDGDGLADHDEGEVDDAADREEGRVAESSDLLLERDREDDADRDEDENEFAAWRGEGKREHRTDQKGEGGRETVLEKVA